MASRWQESFYLGLGGRAEPRFLDAANCGGRCGQNRDSADVAKQFGEVNASGNEWILDSKFSWAPSGKAIYFERTFRGARNTWKMTVDPATLQATAVERLTTGPGLDAELAVSADGKRLAFTGEAQHIRAWLFPFDATHGRVTGAGHAVTSSGVEASNGLSLTRDGNQLAFSGKRAGKWDLWEKSLVDSREAPILADDYNRIDPHWSSDGTRLAYVREMTDEEQVMVWSPQNRSEEALTTSRPEGLCMGLVSGWRRALDISAQQRDPKG